MTLKKHVLLTFLFCVLNGCATSVVVNGYFPEPLVESINANANVNYTSDFKNYRYLEKNQARKTLKNIDFSNSQIDMFDQVFSTLFNLDNNSTAESDLTITPAILDFQYSVPHETKLKVYEVWIKYRLLVTDADNEKLADWVIKGYGKTPTTFLSSASNGFQSAVNIALRDVGAQLAIGFVKQPSIAEYLRQRPVKKLYNNPQTALPIKDEALHQASGSLEQLSEGA